MESIVEQLIAANKVTKEDVLHGLNFNSKNNVSMGLTLVESGAIDEQALADFYAETFGFELLDTVNLPLTPCFNELPLKFMQSTYVLPVSNSAEEMVIAIAEPDNELTRRSIEIVCENRKIRWCIATFSQIRNGLESLYQHNEGAMDDILEQIHNDSSRSTESEDKLRHLAAEEPIVRLVNLLIHQAIEKRASDIHIEPFEERLFVRYRIDGALQNAETPPVHSTAAIISRIKLIAGLNIAEHRLPQDGRVQLRIQSKQIDLRISTVPTLYGESMVLRLLDRSSIELEFSALGFEDALVAQFNKALKLPHGMILVSGPTGSGKTTTLYAALSKINSSRNKILTVEDPIEYQLDGINQIQVKPSIGLGFVESLRSILRQDPDIIMIGEMRDAETARIAVQSALTGHLVFSTVHTNDAGSAITRLVNMGIEDYLLTSTLNCVLSQRLLRILCHSCRQLTQLPDTTLQEFYATTGNDMTGITCYQANGCEQCAMTGYVGRTSIVELMTFSPNIRQLILQHADALVIQQQAIKDGMQTIRQHGLAKVKAGITTIDEVIMVTQEG